MCTRALPQVNQDSEYESLRPSCGWELLFCVILTFIIPDRKVCLCVLSENRVTLEDTRILLPYGSHVLNDQLSACLSGDELLDIHVLSFFYLSVKYMLRTRITTTASKFIDHVVWQVSGNTCRSLISHHNTDYRYSYRHTLCI